jgi:large conductance mechanosensitive channel
MLSGFRRFLLRGNIVDLAVAVAIGTAFNSLVGAFGNAFIKPLIGLFLGGGIKGGTYEVRGQVFDVGGFFNAVITFLITAAVIYFFVVKPLDALMRRYHKTPEPDQPSRECPQCLNRVPAAAHRCMYCTSELQPPTP